MIPATHHRPPSPRTDQFADSDGPAAAVSPFAPAAHAGTDIDLAYPPAEIPLAGRGTVSLPDTASFVNRTVEVVAGWTVDDSPVALPPGWREQLLDRLPHLLVDGPDREVYLGHLRAARAAPGRAAAADAVALRVPLPTDRILRDGLAGVSDAALGVLATDPSALRSLSALIDESADAGEVGPAWWAAIHRAGRKALADRPLPGLAEVFSVAGRTPSTGGE